MSQSEVTSTTPKTSSFISTFSGSPIITTENLIGGSNYLSWSASVELWFTGQGYEVHLTKKLDNIPDDDKPTWKKVDAQLCSLLWMSINSKLLPIFRAYKTCYTLWEKAKTLYTNDIQRFYSVVYNMVNLK